MFAFRKTASPSSSTLLFWKATSFFWALARTKLLSKNSRSWRAWKSDEEWWRVVVVVVEKRTKEIRQFWPSSLWGEGWRFGPMARGACERNDNASVEICTTCETAGGADICAAETITDSNRLHWLWILWFFESVQSFMIILIILIIWEYEDEDHPNGASSGTPSSSRLCRSDATLLLQFICRLIGPWCSCRQLAVRFRTQSPN